jgi:hypothetical protein
MVTGVLSRSVARVNVVLMLHAELPLPVAVIARAAGLAYTPAASALSTLEKRRLVRRTRRAGQDVFEPDRHDPHYPMAHAIALVDLPLAEALRGQRVDAAYAYGSLSRPDGGTPDSDLDLFLVGDVRDRDALVDRLSQVGARLGRRIDPFILAPEEFERARSAGDARVASALAGVRIFGVA